MRRWPVLIALCAVCIPYAREDVWLRTDEPQNASYLAPKMRVSRLQDSLAFWPGLGIGWIVGSVISVGFEGYLLADDPRGPDSRNGLTVALGGLDFAVTPFPERRTHMAFDLLVGAGGSQAGGETDLDSLSRHGFFFASPGAKLEFNLTRNIRFCPGISYLWSPDPIHGLDGSDGLDEPMLSVDLILKQPDPD
jgi:hypothetical protein